MLSVFSPRPEEYKNETPVVAIDCEMVDCSGKKCLARFTLVNYNGHILMDQYIRPEEPVTDFLTFVSGITPSKIKHAPTFNEIKKKV